MEMSVNVTSELTQTQNEVRVNIFWSVPLNEPL